jgi:hypothetical protein
VLLGPTVCTDPLATEEEEEEEEGAVVAAAAAAAAAEDSSSALITLDSTALPSSKRSIKRTTMHMLITYVCTHTHRHTQTQTHRRRNTVIDGDKQERK